MSFVACFEWMRYKTHWMNDESARTDNCILVLEG